MSVSDTISAVSQSSSPIAVWSQIDANHAKVVLNGVVNVYTLGEVWTQIRDSQSAWLASIPKANIVHYFYLKLLQLLPWMVQASLFNWNRRGSGKGGR
jgi:hypothetical protein